LAWLLTTTNGPDAIDGGAPNAANADAASAIAPERA